MAKELHPENLKPIRDSERARELGRRGGYARSEKNRQRRMLSHIYAEYLQKKFSVKGEDGKKRQKSGEEIINDVVTEVLQRKDSVSVSMLHEMGLQTEGEKINLNGLLGTFDPTEEMSKKERDIFAKELKNTYNIEFK